MRRPITSDKLSGPDPGEKGSQFIGWLLKKRSKQPLKICEVKARQLELDLEKFCKDMGIKYIKIDRDATSKGAGKEFVCMSTTWAQNWTRHHGNYIPHHKEHFSID